MNKIIKDNYDSIVKRGLITPSTTSKDFIKKLDEEVKEFKECIDIIAKVDKVKKQHFDNLDEELADIILVCLNFAKHYDIDIEKQLIKKIKKNYERASI